MVACLDRYITIKEENQAVNGLEVDFWITTTPIACDDVRSPQLTFFLIVHILYLLLIIIMLCFGLTHCTQDMGLWFSSYFRTSIR